MSKHGNPTPNPGSPGPDPGSPSVRPREGSFAFRELMGQRDRLERESTAEDAAIAALTGDDSGPAEYDLRSIWRGALADDGREESAGRRRCMSPRRCASGWPHLVSSREDGPGDRIPVDREAAFHYGMHLDSRMLDATIAAMMRAQDLAIAADPIGHAVASCRGGPVALVLVAHKVVRAAGLTPEQFPIAVLERAKREAAGLKTSRPSGCCPTSAGPWRGRPGS